MLKTQFSPIQGVTVAEAEFDPSALLGFEGIAYPRLFLPITLVFSTSGEHFPEKDLLFDSVVATLNLNHDHKVADAIPTQVAGFQRASYKHSTRQTVHFEFPLDYRRMEHIERIRDGDLRFRVWIGLKVTTFKSAVKGVAGNAGFDSHRLFETQTIQADVYLTIPESHWRKTVLPGIGFGNVQVVELTTVSLESCEALEHSYKALRKAEAHLKLGLYDDSAAACRTALDQFFEYVDKPDGQGKMPKLKKSWEVRLGEASYHWLNKCMSAVKGATNASHHSASSHFDRFEAQMLFLITTGLVSYAARTLDPTE